MEAEKKPEMVSVIGAAGGWQDRSDAFASIPPARVCAQLAGASLFKVKDWKCQTIKN